MKRLATILLILTCATASVASEQLDTTFPSSWRDYPVLDGVLTFKAPKDVVIVPVFDDKYLTSSFRAAGLRIDYWFDDGGLLEGKEIAIGGHPAQILESRGFSAVFFPDVAMPKPGGIGEMKGLRLNVSHEGKPEEAEAIIRSIRFSTAGSAIEKAAQAQAASRRTWKSVAAGDILTFDAPPSLQPREPTANDVKRHQFRAPDFEVEIESRKIADPPPEYAGKETARSRFRIGEHWAEVFVKPGRMIAYFQKSLSATAYEGPVIEFRFDNFEAQENAVALLHTIRLQPLMAYTVRAPTPVPSLRGASAVDQLFFAIAFTVVDEVMTNRGAEGATVEYDGNSAIVTFPILPRDNLPKGTSVTGASYSARVLIDRASGTITQMLVGS